MLNASKNFIRLTIKQDIPPGHQLYVRMTDINTSELNNPVCFLYTQSLYELT